MKNHYKMTHERMYQKILKTHQNKAPKEIEELRKTHKKYENSSSKKHTKIRVCKKTKKTENGSPPEQNQLAF